VFDTIVIKLIELYSIIGQSQCYDVNSGFDIAPGSHDIIRWEGMDLGPCCDWCKATPDCQAYVWSKSSRTCFLKDVTQPRNPNDDLIIGLSQGTGVNGKVITRMQYYEALLSIAIKDIFFNLQHNAQS